MNTRPESDDKVVIRQLQNNEEFLACEALEKDIWGQTFRECVPPSLLMVSQKVGGVTAGAFDSQDKLIGFVYGLTGWKDGRMVHWSHMLAVREEYRDRHLGTRLKLFQRDFVRHLGVEKINWTYEPLVAKNAHINLNRLGARIEQYVPEMYVDGNESDLHRGIGMDRFIVEWDLSKSIPRDEERMSSTQAFQDASVVNTKMTEAGVPEPIQPNMVDDPVIRIEVPADINRIQKDSLDLAVKWRECTRPAFLHYLDRNYRVDGFYRDVESGRCFYFLRK